MYNHKKATNGRKTWRKGSVIISLSNPILTPFETGKVEVDREDIEDCLHFYYDLLVMRGKDILFEVKCRDCAKIPYLRQCIDEMLNRKRENGYLIENASSEYFSRKVWYHSLQNDDPFSREYAYRLERYDTLYQGEEGKEESSRFVLTFSQPDKEGSEEAIDKAVVLKELTQEELIGIKKMVNSFCRTAKEIHNKEFQ